MADDKKGRFKSTVAPPGLVAIPHYRDTTIENSQVILDHGRYDNVKFVRCHMVYNGGPVTANECRYVECQWVLGGAASMTLEFLSMLYGESNDNSPERRLVDEAVKVIKAGEGFP